MTCPRCGNPAELYGLPAGIYGGAFKCYNCHPHGMCFTASGPEAEEVFVNARATSRAAAREYFIHSDQTDENE